MTFVNTKVLEFVKEVDIFVREFVNDTNFERYGNNLLEVVHFNINSNASILKSFKGSFESESFDNVAVKNVCKEFVQKLCNTRVKEYFRGKFERDLGLSGKVVDADQCLRDTLKTYSVQKKRS